MRSPSCTKPVLRKGPWTPEEDLLLSEYIKTHGEGGWTNLPKKAGLLRCGKSCRLRWRNYLRPDVKRGYILPEEEDLILRLHRLLGNRWALIARRIPGRTDNEIKNYWNTHLSKQLIRKGIDPKTHKPFAPESLQPPLKPPAQKRKKEQLAITDNFIRPPTLVDNKNDEAGFFERPINHNLVELDPQSSVTPTYIFQDDPRLAPLYLVNDIGQNDLMVSVNHQQSQALAAHYQMPGLLGPQSSVYSNQDFQVQAEEDDRKFNFVENIGMPSLVDCDVECKYVGTLDSVDQFEVQVQPSLQGDDCSAIGLVNPGWPNFSNEVSFFNYGLDMPFLSFQAYQD